MRFDREHHLDVIAQQARAFAGTPIKVTIAVAEPVLEENGLAKLRNRTAEPSLKLEDRVARRTRSADGSRRRSKSRPAVLCSTSEYL